MNTVMASSTDMALKRRRAIVATAIGNGLEWFDFTVYSFFAVTISRLFFPTGSEFTSLLLAVATFGVGFFMRPIGGLVVGAYADRVGRKPAMILTILMMAAGTALIGFAPTYASVGLAAPLLIVVARLLQGFAAGGEMGGATAFLTEYAPPGQKGFYGSWIWASIGVAVLVGAGFGTLLNGVLSPEQLGSWGWRLPFIAGILIGPLGFYIRLHVDEPPVYDAAERSRSPLKEVFLLYPRETLVSFGLTIVATVCVYVLLFYMPTYAIKVLKLPASVAFQATAVGSATLIVASPLVGWISDQLGRRTVLMFGSFAILVSVYPMFRYVYVTPGLASLIEFQVLTGLLVATYTAPLSAAYSEIFPTKVLSSGLSVAYNFAVTIFGGFAPFFLTWYIGMTGDALAPAYYVMFAALLSLACVTQMKPVNRREARALEAR